MPPSPHEQPLSAHPELVEGWAAAIPALRPFPPPLPILQQVQDERIYGFPRTREGRFLYAIAM